MNLGDFGRKLKKLNKHLRIVAKDTGKPAGINMLYEQEWINICSIDKNEIPRLPIREPVSGRFIKGGWRRALKALIDKRLIDRRQAEWEFGCSLDAPNPFWVAEEDPTMKAMAEIEYQRALHDGLDKNGKAAWKKQDVMDMASVIRKARRR